MNYAVLAFLNTFLLFLGGISFNDTTDPEAVDFPMGKKEQNEVTNKQSKNEYIQL